MEAFSIAILAFDGVDELDVVGPYEVFVRVAQQRPGVHVSIASVSGETELVGAYGLRFHTDGPLEQMPEPDLLVIPGGGWVAKASRGVRAEIARGDLPRLIAKAHESKTRIASVCTGAMALAASGIMENRPATTHRGAMGALRSSGATIIDAHVVDDGKVSSSGGVTHGIDLALWLVERFFGNDLAEQVATALEYSRTTSIWVSPETVAEMETTRRR